MYWMTRHYPCDSHVHVRHAAVNVTLYCHVRITRALQYTRYVQSVTAWLRCRDVLHPAWGGGDACARRLACVSVFLRSCRPRWRVLEPALYLQSARFTRGQSVDPCTAF
jgi:hypothetical protein